MCARWGPWAAGVLALLAACGRIGYEGAVVFDADIGFDVRTVPTSDVADQPLPELPIDAGLVDMTAPPDVSPPDVPRPDVPPPDVPPPDVPRPDVPLPDVSGAVDAPPRDAGFDAPSLRTVVATGQNATPRRGGGTGTSRVDICPDGKLLVGYEGTASTSSGFIKSVVGICAAVTMPSFATPATPWELTPLPARGDISGDRWVRMCPSGQLLVGFDGNAGSAIGQLVLACAPISFDSSGRAVVLGAAEELDDVGAPRGSDFPQTDCPAGQAARGAETRAGSELEAFGLVCGTLVLR